MWYRFFCPFPPKQTAGKLCWTAWRTILNRAGQNRLIRKLGSIYRIRVFVKVIIVVNGLVKFYILLNERECSFIYMNINNPFVR